jgi:hypothetical protein
MNEFITPEQLFAETDDEALLRASSDIPVRLTLHGRDFDITEPPMGVSMLWGKGVEWMLRELAEMEAPGAEEKNGSGPSAEAAQTEKALKLISTMISYLPEKVSELVFDFMRLDVEDREWIRNTVTQREFKSLVKVVFHLGLPFLQGGGMVPMLMGGGGGQAGAGEGRGPQPVPAPVPSKPRV